MNQSIEILNKTEIEDKVNRLAYQIIEDHIDHGSIILAGISQNGTILAQLIAKVITQASSISSQIATVIVDKTALCVENISLNINDEQINGAAVIICDDVLYTGKTLMYVCQAILNKNAQSIHCLVMVKRNFLKFPIYARYVGLSLATTLQEHVEVYLDEQPRAVLS